MGQALIAGLRRVHPELEIFAADIDNHKLLQVAKMHRVYAHDNNHQPVEKADIIILAVKPQHMQEVLEEISAHVNKKLVISIAAGISLDYLSGYLKGAKLIRSMPNNPALVGAGITAISPAADAGLHAVQVAEEIFKSIGEVIILEEKYQDAVTGLSGSGPAFVYLMLQGMIEGGLKSGLDKEVAGKLALQTMLGAVKTLQQSGKMPDELISMVASPGGTTEKGLAVLEKGRLKEIISQAIEAATKRAKELNRGLK